MKATSTVLQITSLLDERAQEHVASYNRDCVHYNLIADGVYRARRGLGDPLSPDFQPFIVAGLLGFDMGRTMGVGGVYSIKNGFAGRLRALIGALRGQLAEFMEVGDLVTADLSKIKPIIESTYNVLAAKCALGGDKSFHVGATKILHWLVPDLFIMVDRNVARAFRKYLSVDFNGTTQPGYCAERYIVCLMKAQQEIRRFGPARFSGLNNPGTPVARVFDKVAFIRGMEVADERKYGNRRSY